ncbi:MAG: HRDC domain-containing protein, partial [Pirellulales bacterium]|nr:HRDC domain-containing protein [Pirellulales bacterium]
VPPFRGRAIRMIRRDLDFDRLEIDFEAIERRKKMEQDKLDRVIRFARGSSCRQREILRYFGKENATACDHCDNCRLREAGRGLAGSPASESYRGMAGSPAIDEKVLEAVRMVLSGVARTQAGISCGKNLIAKMLCGSNDSKVKKLRLNKLSTFGLLEHLRQQEVLEIIDALFSARCLQQVDVDRYRPVVELTDFGGEVMRGQATLNSNLSLSEYLLRKLTGNGGRREKSEERGEKSEGLGNSSPPSPPSSPSSPSSPFTPLSSPPDPEILDSLKRWREEISDEAGVPAYYIFTNDTLMELARHRPADRETLLSIRGIGPAKAARYGATLLEIVAEAGGQGDQEMGRQGDVDLSAPSLSPCLPVSPSPCPSTPDSRHWTRRLLSAGFSIEECMAIRDLSRETIESHAR